MSHSNSPPLFQLGNADALSIHADLSALRKKIAVAWQERGVMLTREEQKQLRDEIKATCTFLTDLTVSS